MSKKTAGIHHITAIVGNPQENIDFYGGILGLRLIKQTVNFDDPGTYHLYFGNDEGKPGTIMTFFPWPDSEAYKGRIGDGQVGVTSFAIPEGALNFWKERLEKHKVPYMEQERFGEQYVTFDDPHGLHLEMVERKSGENSQWSFGGIMPEVAIKGFGGATLLSSNPESTIELLEKVMGLKRIAEEGDMLRLQATAEIGNIIDIKQTPSGMGRMGVGTIHHIAWRAKDTKDQLEWKEYMEEQRYGVTPVQDRQYFHAIYFKERGKILFEIATDPPGFARDEPMEKMGEKLMLPEWYEPQREKIEKMLQPIELRELD